MGSLISGSNAAMRMACSASGLLDLAIPGWVPPVDDPNAPNAANLGTRKHELFAGMMELRTGDLNHMVAALQYVAKLRQQRRFNVMSEETVVADWLVSSPMCTPDLVLYLTDELHVLDLKTGAIPVSVYDNAQLMFYAACVLYRAPKAKEITLHIVQPWARVLENTTITRDELLAFMADVIAAEKRLLNKTVQFMPGTHCTFCPANPHSRAAKGSPCCPAMLSLLYPPQEPDLAAMMEEM